MCTKSMKLKQKCSWKWSFYSVITWKLYLVRGGWVKIWWGEIKIWCGGVYWGKFVMVEGMGKFLASGGTPPVPSVVKILRELPFLHSCELSALFLFDCPVLVQSYQKFLIIFFNTLISYHFNFQIHTITFTYNFHHQMQLWFQFPILPIIVIPNNKFNWVYIAEVD